MGNCISSNKQEDIPDSGPSPSVEYTVEPIVVESFASEEENFEAATAEPFVDISDTQYEELVRRTEIAQKEVEETKDEGSDSEPEVVQLSIETPILVERK